jgi:hypothetical protein
MANESNNENNGCQQWRIGEWQAWRQYLKIIWRNELIWRQ